MCYWMCRPLSLFVQVPYKLLKVTFDNQSLYLFFLAYNNHWSGVRFHEKYQIYWG